MVGYGDGESPPGSRGYITLTETWYRRISLTARGHSLTSHYRFTFEVPVWRPAQLGWHRRWRFRPRPEHEEGARVRRFDYEADVGCGYRQAHRTTGRVDEACRSLVLPQAVVGMRSWGTLQTRAIAVHLKPDGGFCAEPIFKPPARHEGSHVVMCVRRSGISKPDHPPHGIRGIPESAQMRSR